MDYSKDDSGYLRFQLSQAKQRMKGRGPQGVQAASEAHDRIKAELARRETVKSASKKGEQTGGEEKLSDADANQAMVDKQDRDAAEDRAIQRAEIEHKERASSRDDPQRDSALSKLAASKEGKAEAAGLAKLYDTMSKPSGYKLDPKVAASNKAQQLAASGEKHAEHKAAASAHIKAGSDAHDAGDEETANAHMAAEQAHDEAAKLAAKAHKSGTPEDKAKSEEASAKAETASQKAPSQATETGSRGGTYYTTESGKKVYVKK